jgi:hypothetical protein
VAVSFAVVVVVERFARQLAVFAGSGGGLGGEVGVGGCEMPDTGEREGCDALLGIKLCEFALRPVATLEQLLVDVQLARFAQVFEPQRPAAALGQDGVPPVR